ncbi:hypothetical protein [Aureispira anguillae]|uniref:hypothetical protein n=1 Tax=Aureispira anguillae TaxID=2864201 RepID=UPI0022310CBE|nr:hypothetical protein [Aureispira anguillae]
MKLYKRTDKYGKKEWLQSIDLSAGAKVLLILENKIDGQHHLPDPTFQRKDLSDIWKRVKRQYPGIFSLSSGAFFGWFTETTARLPFPIKINSKIESCGFGDNKYNKMMLILNRKSAVLKPYNSNSTQYNDVSNQLPRSPNVLVGLEPLCNKDGWGSRRVGRTYIAIKDSPLKGSSRGDGIHESILIYHGHCTEKEAYQTLMSCGASKIMMLCGDAMSQLICQDQSYRKTAEKLPQTIAVIEATSFALN